MILWLLVITFTNSFGIKVSTFHLYHLKLERQSSSPASQVTRHNAERERGEKIGSRKEERSMGPNLLKVLLLSGFVNCPMNCLKVFVFLGQMECKNSR